MAKRGRYPKSGRNRRHDWIDPFVQQQVTLYGIRLLGKHPLTEAFLAFVLSLLRAKDIERLLRIVNEKRRRKGKDLAAPIENQQKRNALAEEILKALVQRQVLLGERELAEHLRAILSRYVPGTPRCFAAERKLSGIAELLNLSPHETDIVSLLYCYGQYDAFEQLCRECKLPALLKLLSVALVCPMRELRRLLAHKERLLTSGVVRDIDPDRSPAIRLNDEVAAHLAGIADIPLAERYCTKVTGRTLDVKRFNMCPRSIGIAQELLSRHGQCHLLLHGAPGTGKTEFAKSIISSTGKQPFFVQHGDSRGFGGESCSDRKMALQVALACVPRDTGILVVDEADDLLNTRTYMFGLAKGEKGQAISVREINHEIREKTRKENSFRVLWCVSWAVNPSHRPPIPSPVCSPRFSVSGKVGQTFLSAQGGAGVPPASVRRQECPRHLAARRPPTQLHSLPGQAR
jgi:hypothetical protein